MKKLLLLFIVTMLTCLGAWAQDEGKPLAMEVGQTLTIYSYNFNNGGTYGPDVIKWEIGDKTEGSVNLVSIEELTGTITTATISDGQVQITVNSACTNVPVKLYFERIITIYEASNNYAGTPTLYEKGVVTFLVSAKGNTCTWSYNGSEWTSVSPVQIIMDKADDAKLFEFTTSWEEKDNESQILSVVSGNLGAVTITDFNYGKSFKINSVAKGEADITVTAKCGNQTDTRTVHVIVNDKSLATTLSLGDPDPSSTFYQGTSIMVPVTFTPETAEFTVSVSPDNQGVTAEPQKLTGNTVTISATESATVGNYTVTVNPVAGSDATAQSVTVTVKDKTHASSIDAPETVSVAYGYTKDIPVTFEPAATAVVTPTYPTIDGVTFSPATLSGASKTISVDATSATAVGEYTITLQSGAGTADEVSKNIILKIIAPQHVTGVTLKEGTTVLGETKTIDKDATFTITAEVAPEDAADASLTWTNSDENVASFNQTTGEVKGLKAGETTITATSKSIAGQPAQTASVKVIVEETLTANVEGFPTAAIKIGDNVTPNVTATNTGISTDDYTVSYSVDPSDVLSYDEATKKFTALKAGTATVTINVTHNGDNHYKDAAPIQKVVEVKKNEYTLAISTDTKLFKTGDSGNAQISVDEIKFNGNVITSGDYAIRYEVKPAYTGVSVDEETGAVTVSSSAAKGQATIVATLTPSDVDNNTTATASVTLTIADIITGGATIKKDGDFYVINVPYPGALAAGLEKAISSGIEDDVTADAAMKSAVKIKITGDINNADMQKFSETLGTSPNDGHHYVGGSVVAPDFDAVLTTLDMSGATLVEAATTEANGHSFTKAFWQSRMLTVTDFTLPTPVASASVLPIEFGTWCPNVTTLTIPEGWTGQMVSDEKGAFNTSATGIQHINLPKSLTAQQYMFNSANLVSIHFAEGTTEIGANAFKNCPALTSVNFPASLETIGASAFQNCTSLPLVDMQACTELTVIPDYAFENCYALATLNLPPNLTDIKQNAFYHYRALKVLIFPNKLDRIEVGAFQNEQGSNSLTDVFFTGTTKTPSYVDAWAFSPNTQMGNNTVADNSKMPDGTDAISNGTITRYSYNNGVNATTKQPYLTTIMHFPVGYTQYYTDPTRVYSDAGRSSYTGSTLDINNKAAFNYTPAGWTDSFVTKLKNAISNLSPSNEFAVFNAGSAMDPQGNTISNAINGGYPDRSYGTSKIWPSQQQMTDGYAISHAGYLWDGTEMALWQKDIRGLYQFINAFGDAPTDPYYWDFKTYDLDKWYTFCVPFNMSVDEIKNVFGDKTQVCRFSSVTRQVSDDSTPNKIILEFRKSVMTEGGYNAGEIYPEVTASTTGILHHVPYMIKPGGTASSDEAYFHPTNGNRRLPNFVRVGGVMIYETITKGDYYYSFEGNLEEITLPNHIYFLANDTEHNDHRYFFSHNATGHLSAYTASVRVRQKGTAKDMGDDDWTAFFTDKTIDPVDPVSQTKVIHSFFGDDVDDATAVEEVRIVCGDDKLVDNDKVYNLGGQQVNGYNLPAGIYIKNGKKFVVK